MQIYGIINTVSSPIYNPFFFPKGKILKVKNVLKVCLVAVALVLVYLGLLIQNDAINEEWVFQNPSVITKRIDVLFGGDLVLVIVREDEEEQFLYQPCWMRQATKISYHVMGTSTVVKKDCQGKISQIPVNDRWRSYFADAPRVDAPPQTR
jgi:hypothetical protein